MFRIDSTGSVWINKGDIAKTQIFIDTGTSLYPSLYKFERQMEITCSHSISESVEVDKVKWSNKVLETGEYEFIYTHIDAIDSDIWTLNSEEVNLEDYGITVDLPPSRIPVDSSIDILYTLSEKEEEVYFYLFKPLQTSDQDPVMKKIISPSTNSIQTFFNGKLSYEETRNCVSEEGNIILYINPRDTGSLKEGEYYYQIKAKLFINDEYQNITICNKKPFLIIDDDYSDRVWS